LTSPLHSIVSRRTALRAFGLAGLTAAGLLASAQAHASGDLVVVDQIGTGPWDSENCGPTSAVIAMVTAGRQVPHYVSGHEGTTVGGNRRAVIEMRARCGLSPWDDPSQKSVDYMGAYLGDLENGIRDAGARATRARFPEGLEAAAQGAVVILHVHHGRLLGDKDADYGHFVVAQGEDADGNLLVSDPGRAQENGIAPYSPERLLYARQGAATLVS
jgi:hypothetical protein